MPQHVTELSAFCFIPLDQMSKYLPTHTFHTKTLGLEGPSVVLKDTVQHSTEAHKN
jgi:hypothetical protein